MHDKDVGWLLVSDNPDRRAWPMYQRQHGQEIIGEVRWVWYSLP